MMKALALTAILALGSSISMAATAEEEGPFILAENSWVCVTPEAYDQAIAEADKTDDIRALRKEFLENKLCMTIDDEDIEDMMAPFVQVTDRQDEKIKVRFEVEFYKRIAYLHRNFARITFAGWTHENRLKPRSSLADD
jgi:Skp family chaperone for outer membrane proteins